MQKISLSKKHFFTYLSIFFSSFVFSQGETNIWYFGFNAGLDFSSGSPVALTNGQLHTDEGCAVLSTSTGQLLLYTDGSTIYNRNHQVMLNGAGLMGHFSSSQSATIVTKPGAPNLVYVFTTDQEHDPNGFRYSIVDLNLDGGLGAVTSDKNVLIFSPSIENIGITKHSNGTDYWVVSHDWNNNNFYAYILTASGLSSTPVTNSIGATISGTGFQAAGQIKFAPSGSKLAFTSVSDVVQLFDFNNSTGVISNAQTLLIEGGELYGAEFSPNESVLYITNTFGKVYQFDLSASNIPASKFTLYNGSKNPGSLQLGPDGKIYLAVYDQLKLGLINNPDTVGSGCNLQMEAVDLGGRLSRGGLPSFNQSFFFTPSILLNNVCAEENTTFQFNTNQNVISATWDFGDGNTSNNVSPTHSYLIAGTYTVTVSITTPFGTGTNTREITIFPKPLLTNTIVTLKQCDDNNDGFSAFNLQESESLFVGNANGLTFTYFETTTDAQNNINPITNQTAYINQIVSNDVIFVRIENENGCFRIGQLNLNVSTTLIPNSFQRIYTQCDDVASGSNTDGLATFDFSSAAADIQALYPAGQLLDITYYKNQTDALAEQNAITNISNYTNIDYPNTQNIYVRVDSRVNNDCLGLGHHITLNVEKIPIVQNKVLNHCDDDQDGFFGFDTSNLQTQLLNGLTNVTVSYKDQSGNLLPSPLPNPFNTASQIINVRVTNSTSNACYYDTTIQFIVDDLPEAFPIASSLTTACDDELDPVNQDGKYSFNTSTFQSTILGSQTGMIVNYYDQNNNLLPSPLPNPFTTATQNVTVEVINPINVSCKAIYTIPFIVNPVPKIKLVGAEIVCNELTITKTLNAEILDGTSVTDYTYVWKKDGVLLPTETNYTLNVNQEGIYTVDVTNSNNCYRTRTISVVASDMAIITNVQVNDLSNNNSIIVSVSGDGNYVYSLDNIDFQESNFFNNVQAGIYTVYVKDLNGCGISSQEVSVLGIPKYFTPNGDGYHDYWNIKGVSNKLNAQTKIYIFDRFGKLLKEISSISQGWDGTFNNQPLPSTDYWYSIQLEDGRNIKGHFTLKR